ncbi:MAG: hypothetical protein HKN78_01960 [Sphingomonadaceae bacterium]|nr:hypothetical protein [Sphingomonadaceae bacterium]
MRLSKTKLALIAMGASAGAYALTLPAFGQDAPESLLPEGFGDPVPDAPPPPPPPAATPTPPPGPSAAPPPSGPAPSAPRLPAGDDFAGDEDLDELGLDEVVFDEIPAEYELPAGARRSLDYVGPLNPTNGGYGRDSFAGFDGRYLQGLMRRLDAPVPSRWLHISLRRALLSEVPTAASVSPPDWIAERAWLLLRMGEVDGARMLVQRVDSDRFTPKLYAVAMQAGLATGDPASFCPLVARARRTAETPAWIMADAICAGLGGEGARASALLSTVRRQGITNGFDILFAEKVASSAGGSRAVTIEWDGVERLNAWRFGMATATSEEIPEALFNTTGRQVAAWRARSPNIPISGRIAPAMTAAVLGVFSNRTLVTMHAALLPEMDPDDVPGSPVGNLRAAYVRDDIGERLGAIEALWTETGGRDDRYAGMILSARAATLIPPQESLIANANDLVASMLTSGLDIQAARWADIVDDAGGDADEAWALLAVGAPEPVVDNSYSRLDDYADRAGSGGRHRAQLLAAALAGLGRLSDGEIEDADEDLALGLTTENDWTNQLDRAARSRRVGIVALLSAIGMQSRTWRGVPPSHLYHVVRAFRLAGREPEARMIAAEAVTRG